jgi:hypothetical protein
MTASTACVFTSPWERGKGHVFTEADWNLTASDHAFPYHYSKLLVWAQDAWFQGALGVRPMDLLRSCVHDSGAAAKGSPQSLAPSS